MLRAMEDVVGPAIDRANSLALEQSALVIGHLRMLAIQWSKADGYARACGTDLERLIDTLAPNDGPMTQAAATSLAAARQTDGGAELRYKAMMAGVDALVRAAAEDGAPAFRETLKQGVLAFSSRQSLRDQSWFAASGFDPRPDELLAVDDIIAETVR